MQAATIIPIGKMGADWDYCARAYWDPAIVIELLSFVKPNRQVSASYFEMLLLKVIQMEVLLGAGVDSNKRIGRVIRAR